VNSEKVNWSNGLKQIKELEAELKRRANECPSEF